MQMEQGSVPTSFPLEGDLKLKGKKPISENSMKTKDMLRAGRKAQSIKCLPLTHDNDLSSILRTYIKGYPCWFGLVKSGTGEAETNESLTCVGQLARPPP